MRRTIDTDAIDKFLLRLVGTRSHSTEEAAAAAVLRYELEGLGFAVEVDDIGNVIGTLRLGDGPTVLLDSHLDTVAVADPARWTRDPSGEIVGDRIYGRGTVDMKGPLAACVYGVASLADRGGGTIVVSGTVAEELVEGAALVRVAEKVRPDYVIICEPTGRRIARGQRGRAEVVVEVDGRSCHSAFPGAGINAAEVMADVITAVRALTPPEDPTLGPGILVLTDVMSHPYPGLSVVPERCVATFDRRTLVGETEEAVLAPVQAVVDEFTARWGATGRARIGQDDFTAYTGTQVRALNFAPAWLTDEGDPIVAAAVGGLRAAGMDAAVGHYEFCTNGSGSAGYLGLATIGYGPGEEHRAHTVDESIALDDLHAGARGYAAIVSKLLEAARTTQGGAVSASIAEQAERAGTVPRGVALNPGFTGHTARGRAQEQVLAFHRSLPGYRPTPLVGAPVLADRLGVARVWVKDESSRLDLPSFKILGASWATYRALCKHLAVSPNEVGSLDALRTLVEPQELTLVAATDGNHGRAVALMARRLGLDAHILVPQDMVAARIAGLEEEGARVTVVSGTYDEAVAASARLADATHVVVSDTSWDGYTDVPSWVIDGYSTIAAEVYAQLAQRGEQEPTVVAAQIGVGAFAASVVRGFGHRARIIGSEPTKAACLQVSALAGRASRVGGTLDSIMAGLNCGTPSMIAWPELRAGVQAFVAVDDRDAEVAMRALAEAGVVSGESGAAGLAALLAFGANLGLRPDDRVLVVSTEGATDPDAYARIVAPPTSG